MQLLLQYNLSSFQCLTSFYFLLIRRPPRSTLFPYTRSSDLAGRDREEQVLRRDVLVGEGLGLGARGGEHPRAPRDRKSTRLNSSHLGISYAVFCLKKKNINE